MRAPVLHSISSLVVCEQFAIGEVLHPVPAVKKLLKLADGQVAQHLLIKVLFGSWRPLPMHVDLEARLWLDLEQDPVVVVVDPCRERVPEVLFNLDSFLRR